MVLRHTEAKKRGRTLRGRLRSEEKKKKCLKGSLKRGAEGGRGRKTPTNPESLDSSP